jgi:hypothetical protein
VKPAETAVARHVIDWLTSEHWEVHEEVACGSRVADIVALRRLQGHRCPLIRRIEVKTSLTVDLVEQAYHAVRSCTSHTVEVAFPHNGRGYLSGGQGFLSTLLHREGVGILRVRMDDTQAQWNGRVEVGSPARFGRVVEQPEHLRTHRMQWLKQLQHTSSFCDRHENLVPAGTNRGGHWTPYKGTIHSVREVLKRRGEATIAELITDMDRHHYRTDALAKRSLPSALEQWESDWCESFVRRGRRYFRLRAGAA